MENKGGCIYNKLWEKGKDKRKTWKVGKKSRKNKDEK